MQQGEGHSIAVLSRMPARVLWVPILYILCTKSHQITCEQACTIALRFTLHCYLTLRTPTSLRLLRVFSFSKLTRFAVIYLGDLPTSECFWTSEGPRSTSQWVRVCGSCSSELPNGPALFPTLFCSFQKPHPLPHTLLFK